ncbi:MAG: flagellar basal body L-ring protein FlgH [Methylotenera sp.]
MNYLIRLSCLMVFFAAASCLYAENLYEEDSYRSLISDRRAHKIGDVLTVLVVENSSATATAGTGTDKSNDLGLRFSIPNRQESSSLGFEEGFDGQGKIARSGKLLAQISVTVKDISQNGDLLISGDQLIEINEEKQSINLEGKVRPIDIDERNTVLSTRIAEAKIKYVGDGVLAESQHKGWLSRIISFLGLL